MTASKVFPLFVLSITIKLKTMTKTSVSKKVVCNCFGCKEAPEYKVQHNWGKNPVFHYCEEHTPTKKGDSEETEMFGIKKAWYTCL